MRDYISKLISQNYVPLNEIEISKKAIIHNYKYLVKRAGMPVAPVLKSNAYGHGIELIAEIIDSLNPPLICVDSVYEAYQLQRKKTKSKILIIGYVGPENLKIKKLPFAFSVYTHEMLADIKKHQPHAPIHIFVDSGMHREGVMMDDLPKFLAKAKSFNLNIEGIMSHFAKPNEPMNTGTIDQIKNFEKAIQIAKNLRIEFKYIHLFASVGILYLKKHKSVGNMARAGKALYGIDIEPDGKRLLPALSLKSTIVQIKKMKKGEMLGYDFTYKANKDMTTAILPIGFNDGIDRRLSNKGFVQINGVYCRIIGRVSMNITVVDVSKVKDPKIGQKVTIFSNNQKDKNSVYNAAKICNTIPYEILVHLFPSTKRISIV